MHRNRFIMFFSYTSGGSYIFERGGAKKNIVRVDHFVVPKRAMMCDHQGDMPPTPPPWKIVKILILNGALLRRLMRYFTLKTQLKQVNLNCT